MMEKRPLPVWAWVSTHVLAGVLGWLSWNAAGRSDGEDSAAMLPPERTRHERRPSRGQHGMSGDELLTRITGRRNGEKIATEKESYAGALHRRIDELIEGADRLSPAGDVAAAAMEAIDKLSRPDRGQPLSEAEKAALAEAPLRVLHWLREDPRAALSSSFKRLDQTGLLEGVLSAAVKEKGISAATGWLGVSPTADTDLRKSFSFLVGSTADLSAVTVLKEKIPAARWGELRMEMAHTWPLEKANDLLQLATAEQAPAFVLQYVRLQGEKGAAWLVERIESGKIDPAFHASLKGRSNDEYSDLYANARTLPLKQRAEAIGRHQVGSVPDFGMEALTQVVSDSLAGRDLNHFLNNGRDWRYAFRMGAADVEDLLAASATALPEAAAASAEAMRTRLFTELAEENGTAAISLIGHLPPEQKWDTAYRAAQRNFYSANPQEFYDYLQNIPAETTPEHWERRLDSWTRHTPDNRGRLGEEYTDWVRNLPEGIDREMASFGLLRDLGDGNPILSAGLRAGIQDPRLLEKLDASK